MSDDVQTLADIEARRAKRREASAAGKAAQHLLDMGALDALEEKHGEGQVKALFAPTYVPLLPTLIVVKSPAGDGSYKRFADKVREAKGHPQMIAAAGEVLARACIVYPSEPALLAQMVEAFPNLLNDATNAAASFVALQAEAEKKG